MEAIFIHYLLPYPQVLERHRNDHPMEGDQFVMKLMSGRTSLLSGGRKANGSDGCKLSNSIIRLHRFLHRKEARSKSLDIH